MTINLVLAAFVAIAARPGVMARVEHVGSSMVLVSKGMFAMGFPDAAAERDEIKLACVREFGEVSADYLCGEANLWGNASPGHEVYLPAFELDRYEVTVAEYRVCAAASGCDVAPLVSGDHRFVADSTLPIVNVSWYDAADYCAWSGKRLPTEAEWEKAARGGDQRRWPWGNHDRRDGSNHGKVDLAGERAALWEVPQYVGDASDGAAHAVAPGAFAWSDGPYGAFDLAGNVSEWVADYYRDGYDERSAIDPVRTFHPDPAGSQLRVYRGGSWAEPKLFGRTHFRLFADANQRAFDRGFRCARDVAP